MASESCVYIFSLEHFVVLEESSWGCMSYQLLNHEQLLPIPVSSDTTLFQRYIFKIDLPNLSRICYIALSRSFGRIAFEFHDVVRIFHTLFQRAMLYTYQANTVHWRTELLVQAVCLNFNSDYDLILVLLNLVQKEC